MVWLPRRQDVRKKPYLFLELFNHDTFLKISEEGVYRSPECCVSGLLYPALLERVQKVKQQKW